METTGVIIVESLPKITVALLKICCRILKFYNCQLFGPEDHGEVY